MNSKTSRMTTLAILSTIALLLTLLTRSISFIPGYSFLTLDMKDVVIAISGLIYGPMSALLMSVSVSAIEMVTVSATGIIGMVMNVISSCAFACIAAFIYTRRKSIRSAVVGLVAGALLATACMLLWNYIITPLYMGVPRHVIVDALLPAFLPFNLIKYGLCAAFTVLLYKPLVNTLRHARLLPTSASGKATGNLSVGLMLAALLALTTLVLIILSYLGVF